MEQGGVTPEGATPPYLSSLQRVRRPSEHEVGIYQVILTALDRLNPVPQGPPGSRYQYW